MKRKLTYHLCPLVIPLCLWLLSPVMGQDCSIKGHVVDGGQTAVATAVVTVTQEDSGSRRQVLSNAQGYFQLAALPPGKYQIDAVKPGFKPQSQKFVELDRGPTATIDLQMEKAGASEPVTLEARKTDTGSLLAYIMRLLPGIGL
jgi:carboxypeptidase family protein